MIHDWYKFDVDLARSITNDGREAVEMDPDDVRYAVEWSRLVRQHLAHVDVKFPGIVAHYWFPERDGSVLHGTVLIDGHHRAARTLELGIPFHVYVLSEEESRRVTVRSPDIDTIFEERGLHAHVVLDGGESRS